MEVIVVPTVSVNETEVKLIGWSKKNGDFVEKGEVICEVETTKSTYDVESNSKGYLYYDIEIGTMVQVGELLAIILQSEETDYKQIMKDARILKTAHRENSDSGKKRFTKKAEIIARKYNLSIDDIKSEESIVTEEIINNHIQLNNKLGSNSNENIQSVSFVNDDLVDSYHSTNRQERILILGAGGGCNLVLDSVSRLSHQRAVVILDRNENFHNKNMMGVKVLGSINLLDELWQAGQFDAVISTIVKDNDERREIFEMVQSKGIPFTNVIDITANIKTNVKMGKGNLIVSGCYLAPSVTIGDNNFLAAYAVIEHHSEIGSHCTFGPRFTASGKVSIGNNCKFGMGISVEPFVKIGQNSTIASGATITGHVPDNSIVKTENRLHIKPKDLK